MFFESVIILEEPFLNVFNLKSFLLLDNISDELVIAYNEIFQYN